MEYASARNISIMFRHRPPVRKDCPIFQCKADAGLQIGLRRTVSEEECNARHTQDEADRVEGLRPSHRARLIVDLTLVAGEDDRRAHGAFRTHDGVREHDPIPSA